MKKILGSLFATFLLVFTLSGVLVNAQEIDPSKEIVIGFDDTFAPFGFKNAEGEYIGFDIDLAQEVFSRMGVNYKFQPIDWSMKETELNAGTIDMIWNGYSVTSEREKMVQFSTPYIKNRQIIIVLADSGLESKVDLAGKIIATQEQSASLEAILNDEEFSKSIDTPVTYATFVEVFSDLDNGRVDGIVVDELLARYFIEQNGKPEAYSILEDNFGEEDYAVGFRKSDLNFVEEFNKVLAEIVADGSFDEIKGRWFSEVEEN